MKNWNTSDSAREEHQSDNFKIDITDVLRVENVSGKSLNDKVNCAIDATPRSEGITNISPLETCSDSPNPAFLGKPSEGNTCGPTSQPSTKRDQWDAFGELIANEFRNLNSAISRKILKRKIMQIMLEVGEEDDKKYTSLN